MSLVLVSHPRLDPTEVKYFNKITFIRIAKNVHNQEVGVNNFDRFQSLVFSAGYFVQKCLWDDHIAGGQVETVRDSLVHPKLGTAKSASLC